MVSIIKMYYEEKMSFKSCMINNKCIVIKFTVSIIRVYNN